jgi:hypothetical protein
MGRIDCDPASHEAAQRTVRATRYYTKHDNGLAQLWHGRCWLNPPYSQPLISRFVDKSGWFHAAGAEADRICFSRGRIKFIDIDGYECEAPTRGQAFHYFGANPDRFTTVFRQFGIIAMFEPQHPGLCRKTRDFRLAE